MAWLTLTPGSVTEPTRVSCFWCDEHALTDTILNVLLFLPIGVGLGMARVRPVLALLAVLALTLLVEGLQLHVVPGRDPSLRDVVANTVGGALGLALGRHLRLVLWPRPQLAWRLAGVARLVWVAVHVAAGWLLAPALPANPTWVIVGTHVGGFEDFRGQVLQSQLQTVPTPAGHGDPRNRTLAGALLLFRPGPRRPALTPIVTIVQQVGVFPFLLGVEGDDVVLRMRTRAADVRLRSPELRFPRAIRPWFRTPPPPRDALLLRITRTSNRTAAEVQTADGAKVDAQVPVRTTHAWAMLWPRPYAFDGTRDLASALWCLLMLVPLGYWTARTSREQREGAWSLAVVAAVSGLAMGPLLFSLALPGWEELVGSVAGLLVGALLARPRLLRRTRPVLAADPALS